MSAPEESLTTYDIADISVTVYVVEKDSLIFPGQFYALIGFESEAAARNWMANHPAEDGAFKLSTLPFFYDQKK
jgi:hypothetical protein